MMRSSLHRSATRLFPDSPLQSVPSVPEPWLSKTSAHPCDLLGDGNDVCVILHDVETHPAIFLTSIPIAFVCTASAANTVVPELASGSNTFMLVFIFF